MQLHTLVYRCKTCGKALAKCEGLAHAQLEQACRAAATQVYCTEPGHVVNANLAFEVLPYAPAPPPAPPIVQIGHQPPVTGHPPIPQNGAGTGAVLGSVMSPAPDKERVDPAADALLKDAVRQQTQEIAQRGGNLSVAAAREHAPIASELPLHPNGAASP